MLIGGFCAIESDHNSKIIYKKFCERNKLNNFIIAHRHR